VREPQPRAAMKVKTKIGMGMKTKMRTKKNTAKKQIFPIGKRGGVLPMLGALGSLIGGAAGVAKAVRDSKATRRQFEELQHHNCAMEGRGLYLVPYKYGKGLYLGPYKWTGHNIKKEEKKTPKKTLKIPAGITTNIQFDQLRRMRIPYFRGVLCVTRHR